MMKISLSNAGKRYNREWIFRHVNLIFNPGTAYAITGPNGSGKSTLLQTIGQFLHPNEGSVECNSNGRIIEPDRSFRHISFCAPYLELIEEMTVIEFLEFHKSFKPFLSGLSVEDIVDIIDLRSAGHKQIRQYSSGMKQRVKLGQCILADTELVLLDEPATNLDAAGIELYHRLISEYGNNRTIIVSSNDEIEYSYCSERISMFDYKKK